MVDTNRTAPPGGPYWGYLIKPDNSPAPLLEQLFLGLTRVIVSDRISSSRFHTDSGQRKLRPGPEYSLTPERLAFFYRSVGGNLDAVFLGPSESASSYSPGLSFLYRTLGCYHSLEPTQNAFETPCIPCLTPAGFVRWQTIQLLLTPDEYVPYLQRAVEKYEILRPDGRPFPRSLPRDALPSKADPAMEQWYKQISIQLNQDHMQRLKNSPYASPDLGPSDRRDGYFGPQIPRIRRPSRNSRDRSSEEELLRPGIDKRRSSLPHIQSPPNSATQYRPPSSYRQDGKVRSHSSQRNETVPRPRSSTTGYSPQQRQYNLPPPQQQIDAQLRPGVRQNVRPDSRGRAQKNRLRATAADEESSAEDASSEDSQAVRRNRRYSPSPRDEQRKKRSSFIPSALNIFSSSSHKRRHSHDATVSREKEQSRKRHEDMPRSARVTPPESLVRAPQHVQFKEDGPNGSPQFFFASPDSDRRGPPSGRRSETFPRSSPVPENNNSNAQEQAISSGTDTRSGYASGGRTRRTDSVPLRISTMSGVGGRRYASAEPQGGGVSEPNPAAAQQSDRNRYSVAV